MLNNLLPYQQEISLRFGKKLTFKHRSNGKMRTREQAFNEFLSSIATAIKEFSNNDLIKLQEVISMELNRREQASQDDGA